MRDEDFDALVFELEKKARLNPERYQLQVLLLALLGNAYLIVVISLITALMLAAVALLFAFKVVALALVLLLGLFLWTLVKAVWVRIPPPAGMSVTAEQAPRLFAMIEEVRLALDAPRVHQVLVSEDFNAAVVQAPQLGLLGWHRNYLLIGLPLMKSLSVEQFKAVLAHEFGHLAQGHGRICNWIYRQRQRWGQLEQALESRHGGGGLVLRPFLNWFAPYFNARSFPLARANEYEADAISVRLTSARVAAEALTNVNVIASYLGERYWPTIHKQADEQPHPAYAPYSTMGTRFATDLDTASTELWLEQSLWRRTTSGDTHPALSDRLRAIGETASLCPPGNGEAADLLLGKALPHIAAAFDQNWRQNILPSWQQRHRTMQLGRKRLDELELRLKQGEALTLDEACERAHLTESVGGDTANALAQWQELRLRAPAHAAIALALGSRLLARDDDNGYALVEQVMRLDESLSAQACELLRDYCKRQGRQAQADLWQHRLSICLSRDGDGEPMLYDRFERHDLLPQQLKPLQAQLKAIRALRSVYLVKKNISEQSDMRFYVLGIRLTRRCRLFGRAHTQAVLRQIRQLGAYPGETLLINLDSEYCSFEQTFQRIPGARIL